MTTTTRKTLTSLRSSRYTRACLIGFELPESPEQHTYRHNYIHKSYYGESFARGRRERKKKLSNRSGFQHVKIEIRKLSLPPPSSLPPTREELPCCMPLSPIPYALAWTPLKGRKDKEMKMTNVFFSEKERTGSFPSHASHYGQSASGKMPLVVISVFITFLVFLWGCLDGSLST